ncbi:hypothetical protein [Leptospira phage LE3]|uniref:Uncharacterized protein n=1 Tax=Leptospira phage LE3 TaxID=2041382 RepID=A0A343LE50_9CAUD|nr:hypothetical protein HWB33_gp34 [Leptospira phage LE3]ATN94960.1 hypothetical protein [Leptospira phage LE3]
MQRNAITDTRILLINNAPIPGLLNLSEIGYDMDEIEVPDTGKIRLITSGNEKILSVEVTYLIKRNSPVLQYHLDWRRVGDARDISIIYTDKSGDIANAYRRDILADCELGTFKFPAFDQGARDKAKFTVKYAPYDLEFATV